MVAVEVVAMVAVVFEEVLEEGLAQLFRLLVDCNY